MTQLDTWTGCYDLGWQNILTPAAFSHPAKFSRGLIFRIVEHALASGMIQPGQTVLDPFGGICAGALPCLQYGLHWIGIELEPKFVELGRENIALWNARYAAHFPNWGTAQVLQGDSRRLCEVVSAAGLVVGSPPFLKGSEGVMRADKFKDPAAFAREQMTKGHGSSFEAKLRAMEADNERATYGSTPGQLATLPPGTPPPVAIVGSPPYAGAHITNITTGRIGDNPESPWKQTNGDEYGETNGQLGAMKPGIPPAPPLPCPPAIISSPPFAGNTGGRGEASRNGIDAALFDRHSGGMKKGTGDDPANLDHLPQGSIQAVISSPPYVDSMEKSGGIDPAKSNHIGGPHSQMNRSDTRYGESNGQLGAMKAGAVIGSPPFENSEGANASRKWKSPEAAAAFKSEGYKNGTIKGHGASKEAILREMEKAESGKYQSPDNIGATQGQTFWEAAALIVQQCALLLPVGGAAIWVVKRYVKDGKIVDFSQQWAQLCESCGFEIVHWHRAMLVKDNGQQETMANGHDTASSATNLLGEETTKAGKPLANKKNITAKKSFFRRLAEKNGSPPIDWEDVICTRKV